MISSTSFALAPRSGASQLVRVPADPAHAISPGQLLSYDGAACRPATATAVVGGALEDVQQAFARTFLGVAHGRSPAGDGGPVSVDVSPAAVYAADVEPGPAVPFGAPLAPAAEPDGDGGQRLSAGRLAAVGSPGGAMARALEARPAGSAGPVRAGLASAFAPGSANAAGLLA